MNFNFLTSLTNAGRNQASDQGRPACRSLGEGRCEYRFPSGRRCRQAVSPLALTQEGDNPHFCLTHVAKAEPHSADQDLAAEIAALAGDFSSPVQVNQVMSKIFHAMLQHRLSAKEAGVLCYIAQTILQSQRAMLLQQKLDAEAAATKLAEDQAPTNKKGGCKSRPFSTDQNSLIDSGWTPNLACS